MLQITDIVERVQGYHPGADLDLIRRCYDFAAKAHDGQLRRSGDPYVVHPLGVAGLISELKLDVPSICAGLLHDAARRRELGRQGRAFVLQRYRWEAVLNVMKRIEGQAMKLGF